MAGPATATIALTDEGRPWGRGSAPHSAIITWVMEDKELSCSAPHPPCREMESGESTVLSRAARDGQGVSSPPLKGLGRRGVVNWVA